MALKLTWDDLLIQNITPQEAERWLQEWRFMLAGRVAPVCMSRFGSWFLRRPDGSTDELSAIEGTVSKVAGSAEEFVAHINTQAWQEHHLLSLQVYQLHERGMVPGPRQCYGFAPHPALAGKLDLSRVMIMDALVWQSICAQLFAQRTEPEASPNGGLAERHGDSRSRDEL
jgi:hypothetical protein